MNRFRFCFCNVLDVCNHKRSNKKINDNICCGSVAGIISILRRQKVAKYDLKVLGFLDATILDLENVCWMQSNGSHKISHTRKTHNAVKKKKSMKL